MTPEAWAAIFAQIFAAVQKCIAAKQPPEAVRAQFRNPEGRALLALELAARKANGMTRREWRKNDAKRNSIMAEVHAQRAAMTEEEIDEFFDDVPAAKPPRRRR